MAFWPRFRPSTDYREKMIARRLPRIVIVGAVWLNSGWAAAQDTDLVTGASPVYPPHVASAHGDVMTRWNEELGLSIEQQAVIADIMRDYAPRIRELMERGSETVWSIMEVAPYDPEYTVDTERASQAAAETAAELVRVASEMRSALHSIMTQEQISTLDNLIQERRQRWHDRMSGSDHDQ